MACRQAIICTNAGILLIGPLGTNFSEILIEIQTFSFTKMHLKMSSAIWRPFCLGLNVLKMYLQIESHVPIKHDTTYNTTWYSMEIISKSWPYFHIRETLFIIGHIFDVMNIFYTMQCTLHFPFNGDLSYICHTSMLSMICVRPPTMKRNMLRLDSV